MMYRFNEENWNPLSRYIWIDEIKPESTLNIYGCDIEQIRIVNIPNVKVSMTIKETIEKNKLLSILNSSFKSVLADYNSSKNIQK